MDPMRSVFSRGPSPPRRASFDVLPNQQEDPALAAPPSDPALVNSSPNVNNTAIDALFSNLTTSAAGPQNYPPPPFMNTLAHPNESNSAPATPGSLHTVPGGGSNPLPTGSPSSNNPTNVLLSLLSTVSGTANSTPMNVAPPLMPVMQPQQPQQPPQSIQQAPVQVPTPPGSANTQRTNTVQSPSSSDQGKLLLDQLMSGFETVPNFPNLSTAPVPNFSEPPTTLPQPAPAPVSTSPPFIPPQSQEQPPRSEMDQYYLPQIYKPVERVSEPSPQPVGPQRQQQRAESPARKALFEFSSPFDALAGTSGPPPTQPQVKKKPVPEISPAPRPDQAWNDPKRKSVEDMMEQLTRGQAPFPQNSQTAPEPQVAPYPAYPGEEAYQPDQFQQYGRPLPVPKQIIASPRSSPPKPQSFQQAPPRQNPRRNNDSPLDHHTAGGQREKESSPVPRGGNWKGQESGRRSKQKSPHAQGQTIVFDVASPLDEIQAPRDSVKSTAIALVKVDSNFLPGTTIGATHWVAYAMTKGRIRVISRSSGDRTLLQLPQTFAPSTSVIDMAVFGNRLAGVTSDGGFVVWELPEAITDDVPGRILLRVLPSTGPSALRSVKWHPKDPDTLALASDTHIYLINVFEASRMYETVHPSDLDRISQVFTSGSPIAAFDFDVLHYALATISDDSTMTLWSIADSTPFWSYKVKGEDVPSSLNLVDGGVVVGRKNGTIFQLLSYKGKSVLSTVKFVNSKSQDDPEMFGHITYDYRIQTLWVANNRRDSMIALRIGSDGLAPSPIGEDGAKNLFVEQVVEFGGPKPTIHFVILTADLDPTGEEALAACVAAKVPSGELALVAFSVHASGVDQVLIRREWFDSASLGAPAKYPSYIPPPQSIQLPQQQQQSIETRPPRNERANQGSAPVQAQQPQVAPVPVSQPPVRTRTPPSDEVDSEIVRDETRPAEGKGRNAKSRNVGWKDKKDNGRDPLGGNSSGLDTGSMSDSALGALTKEIKKTEENLHTKIGRMLTKELDKQHQRMEDARANEQAADFVRQEKILKLISNELTKNTTRVVEMAVKSEVQNSVLPSLEAITKNEVKAALGNQIARGVTDSIKQSIPAEIERVLLRPEVSAQIARTFTSNTTPLIERQIKDAVSKTLLPAYAQQHQDLVQEMRSEMMSLRKEVATWQTESGRTQENVIRDLEQTVKMLSEQVKYLTINNSVSNTPSHMLQSRGSPAPPAPTNQQQSNLVGVSQYRHQAQLPAQLSQQSGYPQQHGGYHQPIPPPPVLHNPQSWFNANIAAPQASHPTAPPPVQSHTPPAPTEEWDESYLAVLGTQDLRQLRELLARSNPEVTMPLNSTSPLSQAVILTLVHRLAAALGETPPVDESFKSTLWWLQRAASVLNPSDPLISPYVTRVVPSVQQVLNSTKQRLMILPGGPQATDAARTITDVQETLSGKR